MGTIFFTSPFERNAISLKDRKRQCFANGASMSALTELRHSPFWAKRASVKRNWGFLFFLIRILNLWISNNNSDNNLHHSLSLPPHDLCLFNWLECFWRQFRLDLHFYSLRYFFVTYTKTKWTATHRFEVGWKQKYSVMWFWCFKQMNFPAIFSHS